MFRKLTYITGAIAVIVFGGVAYISVRDAMQDEGELKIDVEQDQLPTVAVLPDSTKPLGLDQIVESSKFVIQMTDENNELTQMFLGDKLEPRREGEFDVTKPQAYFFLSPHRVIHMQAEKGYFVAPGNRPQSGTFQDNLVISIYETEPGQRLDLSPNSKDIMIRAMLDQATFDTVSGKIDSAGKVRVVSPVQEPHEVEFVGEGLVVVYNQLKDRIDYLEITHGEYLRYTPDSTGQSKLDSQLANKPDQTEKGTQTQSDPARTVEKPLSGKQKQTQYYKVVFSDDVHVKTDEQTIEADQLDVLFSFKQSQSKKRKTSLSYLTPSTATIKTMGLSQRWINPLPLVLMQATTSPEKNKSGDSSFLSSDIKNVVMTWSGPMIMTPIEKKPAIMQGEKDIHLVFTGTPVKAISNNGESLICSKLTWSQNAQLVEVAGSLASPMKLRSSDIGYVESKNMKIDLANLQGQMTGPGLLKAIHTKKGDASGFTIRWSKKVDMTFENADKPRLVGADFIGDVVVDDQKLSMTADKLSTEFATVNNQKDPQLSSVTATGNVHVVAEKGTIDADKLILKTRPTALGKLVPHQLAATGHVKVVDPKQQISADQLLVVLSDKDNSKNNSKNKNEPTSNDAMAMKLDQRVDKVWASGNVVLKMDNDTVIYADTLDTDANKRTATLIGSPVRLNRSNSQLRVLTLTVQEDGKLAKATGPGEFHYFQKGIEDKADRKVDVTWTKAMTYHDSADKLHIEGDVKVVSVDKPTEVNRISADQMTLDMVSSKVTKEVKSNGSGNQLDSMSRVLKKLVARGNVVLLGSRYKQADRKHIDTRFRLAGPILEYHNALELVKVIGPGSLLVEDYRPTKPKEKKDDSLPVAVSGKGATLFQWTGSMTLSGAEEQLKMVGSVDMTHKPIDSNDLIELQAHRITAAMKGMSGFKLERMDEQTKINIDYFEADGAVQMRDSKRLITCEHLKYLGQDEVIKLKARKDGQVEIAETDRPKPFKADLIIWDLKKDRLEVYRGKY